MEGQITESLQKRLKAAGKKSILIINYISWFNSLISTFIWPVDYEKQEFQCKRVLSLHTDYNSGGKIFAAFWEKIPLK